MTTSCFKMGWSGLLCLCMMAPVAAAGQDSIDVEQVKEAIAHYQHRDHENDSGEQMAYKLLTPKDYDPEKAYPVVLFLHGATEPEQLWYCMAAFASDDAREQYPCFVVVPQLGAQEPDDPWGWAGAAHWVRPYRTGPEPSRGERLAMSIIDGLQEEFNTDPDRLYVSGASMGAFAVWDLAYRFPDRFAAAVPICGGGEPDKAPQLEGVAVWAFHGAQDDVIAVEWSREMIDAMKQAGLSPRYTEYPDVKHDSWIPAYREPELLPWLFTQSKSNVD